jgi:ethanolamine utilization protein EutJ
MTVLSAVSGKSTFLARARECYRAPAETWQSPLRFGIDLGTATIVLTAVDGDGSPVYLDWTAERAVRDGVIVDFHAAVSAVHLLKSRAEEALELSIDAAATAFPPGVGSVESRACAFVLERNDIACRSLVDEVSAAQALLGIDHGIIVDVGGGSTGVGIIEDGNLVSLSDMAGGGHHLDLILAGALDIAIEEAEALKRQDGGKYLEILRPGLERIGESIRRQVNDSWCGDVHLVGDALAISGAGAIIERYLDWPVVEYPHAMLITPFGISGS